MAVEIASIERRRKLPWQWPRTSADFRGDCRVALAMAADCRGNCHGIFPGSPWVAMVGTTEFSTERTATTCRGYNRGICRGSAMTRGTCREDPRTSTVVRANTHVSPRNFRGQCCGPMPKSQVMCILDFIPHTTTAWPCNNCLIIARRRGCACLVMRAEPRRVCKNQAVKLKIILHVCALQTTRSAACCSIIIRAVRRQ